MYALARLSCSFHAITLETCDEVRRALSAKVPEVVHAGNIKEFTAKCLKEYIERRPPDGVLIGDGTPCQPNSSLNEQSLVLADIRAPLAGEICRIAREICAEFPSIPLSVFLEQPVGRLEFRQIKSKQFGEPLGIEGADLDSQNEPGCIRLRPDRRSVEYPEAEHKAELACSNDDMKTPLDQPPWRR